jgi:hypothetical protein
MLARNPEEAILYKQIDEQMDRDSSWHNDRRKVSFSFAS